MSEVKPIHSPIDPSFDIYIINPKDELYKKFREITPKGDIAFTDLRSKLILIDGPSLKKLSIDHLNFVIAHEVAHHKLKHIATHGSPLQEMEADLGAYFILQKRNLNKAVSLVEKYWDTRHPSDTFDNFKLNNSDRIQKKLHL